MITWPDVASLEEKEIPVRTIPFYAPPPDTETHYHVKIPANAMVVYYPRPLDRYKIYLFRDLRPGDIVMYLGEVRGMRFHGVFVTNKGKVIWGQHTWNFRLIPDK